MQSQKSVTSHHKLSALPLLWQEENKTPCERRKSSVSFNEKAMVVVHHIDSNEYKNADQLWYSHEELECIHAKNWMLTQSYEAGCFRESNSHSLRGLEIPPVNHCWSSFCAVVDEQYRQKSEGNVRPELLANVYILAGSHAARKEARSRGIADSKEVERFQRDEQRNEICPQGPLSPSPLNSTPRGTPRSSLKESVRRQSPATCVIELDF